MIAAEAWPRRRRGTPSKSAMRKPVAATLDGLGLLVKQGVIGVKYWTGVDVDPEVMKRKLEEIFAS